MRQLLNPCPSVAAGAGPFQIQDTPEEFGGCCAPPRKGKVGLFQGPFTQNTVLALGIRAHEYGHLGLSRLKLVPSLRSLREYRRSGIHEAWIQGTLDVIVNRFMHARGNRDISQLVLWTNGLQRELPRWIAATLYLRAAGLRDALLMRMSILARQTLLKKDELDLLEAASRRLATWGESGQRMSKAEYRELLTNLQHRLGPESADANYPFAQFGIAFSVSEWNRKAVDLNDHLGPLRLVSGRGGEPGLELTSNCWGPMEILAPPLPFRSSKHQGGARSRRGYGFSGPFRFPGRALFPVADGRAFMEHRPGYWQLGTMLIDCSGSMRTQVTHERIMAVLESAPSATIALYAGRHGGQSGTLLIAADKGRHVSEDVLNDWENEGNVIDGPALQWLSRQKRPRVWISDGLVTGLHDSPGTDLQSEVETLTRAGQIRRVGTLDAFLVEK